MKLQLNYYLLFTLLVTFSSSCSDDDDSSNNGNNNVTEYEEVVVVANRGSGSVSFIDANTNNILETLTINGSEPMYVSYVASKDKIYVGDRAQSKVHVINPESRTVENSIDVGNGVFHMWADGQGNQLWVNNDVDNTTSVINLSTNQVMQTIDIEQKPHDVFVSEDGTKAYVSVLIGDNTVRDSVYAYSTSSFNKITAKAVGDDPHLFLLSNNQLYVPNQSGELYVLDGDDLTEITQTEMPGAHGIYPTPDEQFLFITNLPGGEMYSYNVATNRIHQGPLATEVAIPHNITVNEEGTKAFVTHSGGMANKMSVYNVSNGNLAYSQQVEIGTNPFGIAYYKREL